MTDLEVFAGIFEQAFQLWATTRSGSNEAPPSVVEPVLTVSEFCQANRISPSHYYSLKRAGEGPREMQAGGRILITPEANRDWRIECEKRALDEQTENAP